MYKINYHCLVFLLVLFNIFLNTACDENNEKNEDIWQQDLTDAFKIDASTQGIQKVNLKCGSNSMHIQLETEDDFSGVMYTRGSFYKQSEPCFVKPRTGKSRSLEMNFPFDQCQTMQDGDVYTNIVVVQHDPELVTPGDAAFSLECDFRKSRSIHVEADMQTRDRIAFGSRITLTSPDPSATEPHKKEKHDFSVHSESHTVAFIPSKTGGKNEKVRGTVESIPINDNAKNNDEL